MRSSRWRRSCFCRERSSGLARGALFGPLWGSAWNLAGATLGATLAFLTARYVASGWVARRSGGRLKGLIEGVEAEGWRFVAVVRLVPVFPFNLLNYALGLTRLRLSHYVAASAIAMIPGTVANTWLGHAGHEVAAGSETAARSLLVALGCWRRSCSCLCWCDGFVDPGRGGSTRMKCAERSIAGSRRWSSMFARRKSTAARWGMSLPR